MKGVRTSIEATKNERTMRSTKGESKAKGTLQITKDALGNNQMWRTRCTHKLSNMINNKGDVWPNEREILNKSQKMAIFRSIRRQLTIKGRHLKRATNWCSAWLTISRGMSFEKINNILSLQKMEAK